MGNCLAVGLSSGFVEPLESTGIHIIIKQIQEFINYNYNLKNLEFNRKSANLINKNIYVDVVNFVALHYNTNRTDSEFWKHVKDNKPDWVKDIDEKIREGFVDASIYRNNPLSSLWTLDSYVQVTNGLKMISKESIQNHLNSKPEGNGVFASGKQILEVCKNMHDCEVSEKNNQVFVSHKGIIDSIHK